MQSSGSSWEEQSLSLKELSLWDENARFPDKYFSKTEQELIHHFCSKKTFKMEILAQEIVKDFDLPQLEKVVIYRLKDKNIVLEGNRRVAAYKLLNNPELAPDSSLKKSLQKLSKEVNLKNLRLDCLITNDYEQGARFIERKHLNGNNEVPWGDNERSSHRIRSQKASQQDLFRFSISEIVKSLNLPEEFKENVLGPGYVTSFWRIIDSAAARSLYGIRFNEKNELIVEDGDFPEELRIIILNILNKKDFSDKPIHSRSLNKVAEVESYLKRVKKSDGKRVDKEIEKNSRTNLFQEKVTALPGRVFPKSTSRPYLIPKTCILRIDEPKINNIYRELRNDLLLDDSKKAVPNAVAVLFRVFLESSIDAFWNKQGQSFSYDEKLRNKIITVANFLQNSNLASESQLKNIRTVASNKSHLLAVENFHAYVHSYKTQAEPSDLKVKWENLQEFFEIIWARISMKK